MAKSKSAIKIKKKQWCEIIDSGIFGGAVLGESYVEEPSLLLNKVLTINMMELLRDIKKQNVNLMFIVKSLKEGKGVADVIGYGINNSSVKRMMRRGKERIDFSKAYQTKDGNKIRIKPFMVTRLGTYKSRLTAIRALSDKLLAEAIAKDTYTQLIKDMVNGKLQGELKGQLDKIVPLVCCEIRMMRLISGESGGEKKEEKPKRKKTEAKHPNGEEKEEAGEPKVEVQAEEKEEGQTAAEEKPAEEKAEKEEGQTAAEEQKPAEENNKV